MRLFIKLSIFCLALIRFSANAQLKLPALFTDHMVLQQAQEVTFWGWASAKENVTISASWSDQKWDTKASKSGEWETKISTPSAGGPYSITIASDKESITLQDVMSGEVWLCAGQSNMEMPMRGFRGEPVDDSNDAILHSANSKIRMISVPRKSTTIPQENFEGAWSTATPKTVAFFSATGYYFGKLVQELTDVPVGLIDVTYGGSNVEAWMNESMLLPYEDIIIPANDDSIGEKNRTPTVLFNGMMNPVVGYTIKGAIWYQGESNAQNPVSYQKLFPDMIHHWRALWDQGVFPFYYMQIAPFNYDVFYGEEKPWYANSAYIRDAQRKCQYIIPNSQMACALDIGDLLTIHPRNKKAAGERLAYIALTETYGIEGIGALTPDIDQLNIEENIVTVTFNNLPNGLTSYGETVTAFEIAGEDGIYYPAECKVRRKTVQLSSEKVAKPVHIRYAFTNAGPAQLFSTEGIPFSSFSTENWEENVNEDK